MRLRKKTLIIITLTLVGMVLLIYAASQVIIMQSMTDIETGEVSTALNSSLSEINYDLSTLDSVTVDYAYWDDTYSYVQNGSPRDYVQSNFVDATMLNQKLNVVVIASAADRIVYARGYDPESGEAPVPAGILGNLSAGSPLSRSAATGSLHGIIMLPDGPMLISAYPILKSDGAGAAAGTMIMGRYLNEGEVGVLENMSDLAIAVRPFRGAGAAAGFEPAGRLDAAGSGAVVEPRGADTISGYALIRDIYGNPALVLRVDEPRTAYQQAQNAQIYIVTSLLVSGLVFSVVMIFFLEKMVVSPVIRLNESVGRIGPDTDISARVPARGDDEVAQLAATINRTLDALGSSRRQLQDREQRFRSLVENINDVVWEADAAMKLTYVSPQTRAVLGYEPEDILGRSPFDLVDPREREQIRAIIHDMIVRKGSFALVEFAIARPDGGRAEIEVGGNPILDAAGKIVGYRGIARDVGARKRAEAVLRESEERLRLCAATARFGTFDWDIVGDRHLWSPETYEIYGLPPSEPLTLDNITGRIYPGDRKDAELAEGLDPAGPGEYTMEYRIVRASDGAVRWVYVKGRVFFAGEGAERKAVRVLGAIQDVTGRKQAEEALVKLNDELESRVQRRTAELRNANAALQESERRYRELVHYANSMIVRFDMEGRIIYFNEFACSFFGYSHDEIIGMNVLDTIVPQTESSGRDLSRHMRDLLKHPDQYEINVNENVRRNGERVWVSWTNKAFLDSDGRIAGILAIGNDITDLKRASEELKRVNDSLESRVQQRTAELASAVEALQAEVAERKRIEAQIQSSLQEKEVLLKEIHHRVKNNLQIISSLLSLQADTIGSENPAQTFRESQDRIRSMALIHEKLYQARDISRVDFGEYARSLTSHLARSYLCGPNVRIHVDIADVSLGIDMAIPCGLIVNELVSNALKYAFPGGRAGEIRIGLARDGDAYTLVVADDGVGLPPDLDFRKTRTLGLQLVHTLVDQLEGTIELDSGAAGTMIRITFSGARSNSTGPLSP